MKQGKADKQSLSPYSINPGRLTTKKWYQLLCILTSEDHMRDMYGLWNAGRARSMEYNECLILDLLESPLKRIRIHVLDGAVVEKEFQVGHEYSLHRLFVSQYFCKYRYRLLWLKDDVAPNLFQDGKMSLETVPMGAEKRLHNTPC